MATPQSIKVLTLNCWGLKYVSKERTTRIHAIADELANSSYDLVCLQELWVHADFQFVRNAVARNLPFSKFYFSGALGSGLAMFTRYPIMETSIRPYSLNGSPLHVAGGDFFVGKSIVSAVLDHPVLGEVEVFNTHMYAEGGDDGEEWRRAHRVAGAWQFANLARASTRRGRYIIAAGDFNSVPTTLPIAIILSHGGLIDAWAASHDSSLFPTDIVHNPQHAIHDFGITADSPLNTFSAGKPLSGIAKRWQGKRLDYVFYRNAPSPSHDLVCTNSQVVFTNRVPGQAFSYSDHFGLEVTLEIRSSRSAASTPPPQLAPVVGPFSGSTPTPSLRLAGGVPLSEYGTTEMTEQSISAALAALGISYRNSQGRSTMQLAAFVGILVAAIGLVIGSAWLPKPEWSPLFVFAAVVLGWGGTTMLYTGFIYGNYELNMLVNTIEELELLRSRRAEEATNSSSQSPPRR